MIVTIDGPSGVGKSTVGRCLAERMGFIYLNTGVFYRVVALAFLRRFEDLKINDDRIFSLIKALNFSVQLRNKNFVVFLDNCEVNNLLNSETIGDIASQLSVSFLVRDFLLKVQRDLAKFENIVAEGRDMGTVIYPEAFIKFFLIANKEERVRRRYFQLKLKNRELTLEDIFSSVIARDQRDETRDLSPLIPSSNSIIIDSTKMKITQVVNLMRILIERRVNA